MSRIKGDKRLSNIAEVWMYLFEWFALLVGIMFVVFIASSCSFNGGADRPGGEYSFDLTERLKIISTHKPIRGYTIRGCWHSFQRGRGALEGEDVLYCYLCNRAKDKYIETQYHYDIGEWITLPPKTPTIMMAHGPLALPAKDTQCPTGVRP